MLRPRHRIHHLDGCGALRATRRVAVPAAFVLLVSCVAAAPALAAFVPGRFVVEGRALTPGAGKDVSVHLAPKAVAVDGCLTKRARMGSRRDRITLTATVRCGRRTVKLTAQVRGRIMRGKSVSRRGVRRFKARRARPEGVLLKGKRSGKAIGAVRDVNRVQRHRPDQISKLGRTRVARRELVVRLERGATVAQVGRALRALGGAIVGSLTGSPTLIVAIPDPGGARPLKRVVSRLKRAPGIESASASAMAETQQLPPGIATPPTDGQEAALSHLLASGIVTAWNARAAIRQADQPTVIVADSFGDGPLSRRVDAQQSPRIQRPRRVNGVLLRGRDHGYQVASIIFGDFASDGTRAGLVTGAFPGRGRLITVDAIDLTLAGTGLELIETLESVPTRAVVSTSLGRNGGQLDREMFPEAADWIRAVRRPDLRLEGRVLHTTSAGNDAASARFNGLWAAAALRDDILDELTGGRVGPLTNTLAVEAVMERSDSSGLACLFPTSNLDGTIAAPGDQIYSLDRDGRVAASATSSGTSFATPVVAGLATYLWSIAPDLTPQQLKAALVANPQPVELAEQNCVSAPRLDAYRALLSLDQPGPPSAASYPVRLALLDLNGDGAFTEADLQTWATAVDPGRAAGARDWSRHDLNGDGFTGGTGTRAFDLDRTGSQRAGITALDPAIPFPAAGRTLNENAATDAEILCYYAYSPLYTGDPAQARTLLDPLAGCGAPKIVFVSLRDGNAEIYAMNPDGSGQKRLTNNSAQDSRPALSPDGRIAFVSNRDSGDQEVYRMNSDGSGQTRLTTSPGLDTDPAWSPDGQTIAFRSDRDGGAQLYTMNADGSGQTNRTNDTDISDQTPAWSPDGQRIALARDGGIITMNPDGSSPTPLTDHPGGDIGPDWSPDGQRIAFTRIGPGGNQVWVMSADGSGPTNLTNTQPLNDFGPAWSPDGLKIVYSRCCGAGIRVMNADGSNQATIPSGSTSDGEPDW